MDGKEWFCRTEEETVALGEAFGSLLKGPVVLSLEGCLGAGKTRFVRGLAMGLGMEWTQVASPTFTLVHEYDSGRMPLYHFDFYRLNSPEEAWDLGLEDYLKQGVCAMEWGNKFPELLPGNAIRLGFETVEGGRLVRRITG